MRSGNPNPPLVIKHGEYVNGKRTPEYVAWMSMKQRCYERTHKSYDKYGGRGILMCDRWRNDVLAFIEDVGRRPSPQHSIDRIDNDRGYEPSNVRWATKTTQSRNRRPSTRSGKLTELDAAWIRMWAEQGYTQTAIGAAFGVTGCMVYRIVRGKAWL